MNAPSGRRAGRLVVGAAVALAAVVGLAAPAFAHATLESSNPASGGVVPASPGEVLLHFDEQVAFQSDSVRVYDSHSARVDTGGTRHPPGDSHSVEVAVPKTLRNGGYVVTWRVISADSHPVHGAFTFFIGSTATGGLGDEAAQLLSKTGGDKTVGVVFGGVRFVAFAAAAVFLGGALFAVAIWPAARGVRRARRLIWSGLAVLVVASAASFALQGAYGAGLGLADAVKPSVLAGVWHTRFGHVYAARLVLLAASALILAVILRRRTDEPLPRWQVVLGAILGVAILSTWGLADHAATGKMVALAVPFDVIHIGAAAIWVGGLTMTLGVVLPASSGAGSASPMRVALPRFSQWALGAVIVIAVTGVFAAWRQIGVSWGALTTTPYGKLVIYKSVGFAALMLLASASRTAVHGNLAIPFAASRTATPPTPPRSGSSRRSLSLSRAVGAEIVAALAVLALTAVLVESQPANQAYAAPFSAEVKVGPDLLDAVVAPAKAGPLIIHMYVLTADGLQAPVPEVRATLSNAAAGITGLTVPLVNAGPGHFLTQGFAVPIRGTWTLQVVVRTDQIDEYNADPITVRLR